MHLAQSGSMTPAPSALEGLDAESINRVLELLVAPLQAALPQPIEVVLHDLQRIPDTVRAIAGTVTGRHIGDPPTDKLLERIVAGDLRHETGYRSILPDGRILQSTTIIYTDMDGHAAAALCLNADVSAWVTLRSALDQFVLGREGGRELTSPLLEQTRDAPHTNGSEYFPHSVEELSDRLVDSAIAAVGVPLEQMRKEHKVQVVAELERRGFFLVKQAAENAAAALGVTRFTIYNYLNEIQETSEKPA